MSNELHIAEDFALPLDTATRRVAILATSGAGKSNLSVVVAEEMSAARIPWYAIDPKGDWWGVQSSGNGKSGGLPVPIFGGLHANVPLEPTAGKVIAEAIAVHRLSCVIDVSQMESQPRYGFLRDFAETLLRRNTEALHGFLDECHTYIPQSARDKGMQMACLGAWERLVGQGRNKGLGTSQISQRSALVNKNTLDLCEAIIAMRTMSPRDITAIKGWLETRADKAATDAILDSLPTLRNGEAWVYAPEWMPGPPVRRQARMRWTFDSAATPKVGESRTMPSTIADIDLSSLGDRIAATVERVKAEDPRALRARIAELESATRQQQPVVDTAAIERLTAERDAAVAEANRRGVLLRRANETVERIGQQVETFQAVNAADADATMPAVVTENVSTRTPAIAPRTVTSTRERVQPAVSADVGVVLSKAERSVLSVLAQYQSRTRRQVATLTGYASKGGGFNNALSSLRSKGLLERGEPLTITDAGRSAIAGQWEELPRGADLVEHWQNQLEKAPRAVLGVLVDAYPESRTKAEVAVLAGYEVSGGGFNNALGKLRTLELIEGSADLRASEAFFEAVPA